MGGVLIPLSVFVGPQVRAMHAAETRALHDQTEKRAFTQTSANDGGTTQRPILNKLFPQSIMNILGVSVESVAYGSMKFQLSQVGLLLPKSKKALLLLMR